MSRSLMSKRTRPRAKTVAELTDRGARAHFVRGDIADLTQHARIIDTLYSALGGLDCVVNNAGVSVERRGDLLDVTPESFDRVIGINLRGTFFFTQAVARRMIAESRPAEAPARSIITISSSNAWLIGPDRAEYCISKTGLSTMTKLFALRLASQRIYTVEVQPGIIRTDMTAVATEKYDCLIPGGLTPIARWGKPDDVGRAVAALATGAIPFSTGHSYRIDGGLHIHKL